VAERTEDDILFEEIDEELRHDRANKLWRNGTCSARRAGDGT